MVPYETRPTAAVKRMIVGLFALVGATSCGNAPRAIDQEIATSGAGVVTVVEFVDYDCRFCKELHESLSPMLEEQQSAVRVVIKHVPLEKHPEARRAAAMSICAEKQGKQPEMHDALMKGASRTDDGVIDLAQHVGLDIEAFKACLRSDEPNDRIAKDITDWESLGADGLPMLFIQQKKIVGVTDKSTLEDALLSALSAR